MRTTILILMICTLFLSCNSQGLKTKNSGKHKPHEKVTVTKKYNENGDLIELDSVYTSYYSNIEGDTILTDSVFSQFSDFFNSNLNSMYSDGFFSVDSMLMPGFFHGDFFENQFLEHNIQMHEMLRQMDSLKNSFFEMNSQKHLKMN